MLEEMREGCPEAMGKSLDELEGCSYLDPAQGVQTMPHEEIPGQAEFIDRVLELIHLRGQVYLSGREDREAIIGNFDKDVREALDYAREAAGVAQ